MELITFLATFIKSKPSLFDGIARIRIHVLIIALREEMSRALHCNEADALEALMELGPCELKSLVGTILASHEHGTSTVGDDLDIASPILPKGVKFDLKLSVKSAGYDDGNHVEVQVSRDGEKQDLSLIYGRGMNVVVIDPVEGTVVQTTSFDTHISGHESDEFAKLVQSLDSDVICVVAVKDDGFENLNEAAKAACEALGSKYVRKLGYRDSWCIIGRKGAAAGTVPESRVDRGKGATPVLSMTVDLAANRKHRFTVTPFEHESFKPPTELSHLVLPSHGKWLRRRNNDGALNRVPSEFYPKVWKVLEVSRGIVICGLLLPREPTIYEKTPEEFNFGTL
jgi:hypothetical protein